MRPAPILTIERFRLRTGPLASSRADGHMGAWLIPFFGAPLQAISTVDLGWEHVSVALPDRCPTWDEMSFVKSLFWDDEETVLQYHPPRSQYVNHHPFCLHLWRQIDVDVALPEPLMVGPRTRDELVLVEKGHAVGKTEARV